MQRINGWLTKRSVRENLNLLLILELFIFVIWIISVVGILGKNDLREARRKNETAVMKVFNTLTDDMEELERATTFPVTRDNNGLPTEIYKILSKRLDQKTLDYEISTSFASVASSLMNYSKAVSRLGVINLSGSGLIYDRDEIWRNFSVFSMDMGQPWVEEVIRLKGKALGPILLSADELGYAKGEACIYYVRAIVNAEKNQVIGLALSGAQCQKYLGLFEQSVQYEGQRFAMVAEDQRILLGEVTGWEKVSPTESAKSEDVGWFGQKISRTWLLPQKSAFGVVSITPVKALRTKTSSYILPVFGAIFMLLSATLFISSAVIRSVRSPLQGLLGAVEAYSLGRFDYRAKEDAGKEYAALQGALNTMAGKIQTLIDEVYVHQLEKKDYELRLLRSQINPHFLYNALESARMRAYIKQDRKLELMMVSLASVLKYGLALSNEPVTLNMELHNVESFLNVHNVSASNKIRLIIQADEECRTMELPRMTLQPLVENCIKHGFDQGPADCTIRILAWMEEDCFLIHVIDNGRGMNREALEQMQRALQNGAMQEDTYSGCSIGFLNVHRRIQLRYGDAYGLFPESVEGKGFSVAIRLPLGNVEEEEEEEP